MVVGVGQVVIAVTLLSSIEADDVAKKRNLINMKYAFLGAFSGCPGVMTEIV